jgi:hypothetical protein
VTPTEYRWSSRRYLAVAATIGLLGALIGSVVLTLVTSARLGEWRAPNFWGVLNFVVLYTVVFGLASLVLSRRHPPMLRVTEDGVELADLRRDGTFVPWAADAEFRTRWPWPMTTLVVHVPIENASMLRTLHRTGRRPVVRRRNGRLRLTVTANALTTSGPDFLAASRARVGQNDSS